jgi:hypothetical protein
MDPCSLASTAVICIKLYDATPAYVSKVVLQCTAQQRIDHFNYWLEQRRTSLTNLTQLSFLGAIAPFGERATQSRLPASQLLQLHVQGLKVQLHRAGGIPGMLHACRGLTALHLQDCRVQHSGTAFEAITALPALQHLEISKSHDVLGEFLFGDISSNHPGSLTALSLEIGYYEPRNEHLRQLSALVSLHDLKLSGLEKSGVPGGVPSQLVNLTCLHVLYNMDSMEGHLQHLSSLTALQELSVKSSDLDPDDFLGIIRLTLLTCLKLASPGLPFNNTHNGCAKLTALQQLDLLGCTVQPQALAGFTQLRVLSLVDIKIFRPATNEQLLYVLSQMTLLRQLTLISADLWELEDIPEASAFTALTASTHLCSLQVGLPAAGMLQLPDMLMQDNVRHNPTVFRHGTVLPHLRVIDLQHNIASAAMPLSEQQLQRLCVCCPAVERLHFLLDEAASPAACKPLLQLSALTVLQILGLRESEAAAAALDVAVQLTRLRQLTLEQSGTFWSTLGASRVDQQVQTTAVQRLTALTSLEQLQLTSRPWTSLNAVAGAATYGETHEPDQAVVLQFSNKVS